MKATIHDNLTTKQARAIVRSAKTPVCVPVSGCETVIRVPKSIIIDSLLNPKSESDSLWMIVDHGDEMCLWIEDC